MRLLRILSCCFNDNLTVLVRFFFPWRRKETPWITMKTSELRYFCETLSSKYMLKYQYNKKLDYLILRCIKSGCSSWYFGNWAPNWFKIKNDSVHTNWLKFCPMLRRDCMTQLLLSTADIIKHAYIILTIHKVKNYEVTDLL